MSLVLAVPVADKVAPEIASLAAELSTSRPGSWRDADSLWISLATIDEAEFEQNKDEMIVAINKAAAAHQGFTCHLAGVKQDATADGRTVVRLAVTKKEGMLHSLADSVADRAPDGVSFHRVDPWRSQLILGELASALDDDGALALEAAGHGKGWDMLAKKFCLVREGEGGEVLHEAKLPSS